MKKIFILILSLIIAVCGVVLFFNVDKLLPEETPSIETPDNNKETPLWGVLLDKEEIFF